MLTLPGCQVWVTPRAASPESRRRSRQSRRAGLMTELVNSGRRCWQTAALTRLP